MIPFFTNYATLYYFIGLILFETAFCKVRSDDEVHLQFSVEGEGFHQ